MKASKFAGYTLLGVAVMYFVGKAKAGKNLVVNFKSVKIEKIQFGSSPLLSLTFSIYNPTNDSLVLNAIAGNVFLNNRFVGNFINQQAVTVPPKSFINYTVQSRVSILNIVTEGISIFQNPKPVTIFFDGTVNAEGLNLPIKESITINL